MRNVSLIRLLPAALLLLVLTAGCRTYGGYDTETAIPQQMQQAVQQFADELDRAQSDVTALSEAVQQNSTLEPMEERYRDLIAKHEEFLERHRRIAERFQDGGAYRDLNWNYGAIVSEQRLVRTRYNELHTNIRRVVAGQPVVVEVPPNSRYAVNPPYYDRVQNRQGMTLQEALQGQ